MKKFIYNIVSLLVLVFICNEQLTLIITSVSTTNPHFSRFPFTALCCGRMYTAKYITTTMLERH